MATTRERVRAIVEENPRLQQKQIAAKVGVTRERVRQIIRDDELPWITLRGRLEWDCPRCGARISVTRSYYEKHWNKKRAFCRACAQHYCKRGHERTPETTDNNTGACKTCNNLRLRCIVEVRTCKACEKPLPVSRGMLNQQRIGRLRGAYHHACWAPIIGGSTKKTHCKRGHALTPANRYTGGSCKACMKLRYQRQKTKTQTPDASDRRGP